MRAPWRIAVDVGGTFTDLVLLDQGGAQQVTKVPSSPGDPSRGVLAALESAASSVGVPTGELLASCALLVHGTTIATNTLLEGKGAKVGLLTTHGFRDSLEIRRGIRNNQWDHRSPWPPVLVPRYLRRGVRGRIDAAGRETEPLHPGDVEAAAALFEEQEVEAVAVCFLNSFLEPSHEHQAGEILEHHWSGEWLSLSADTQPILGEYERCSTSVVNAYLAPRVTPYLRRLDAELRSRGLVAPLLLIQSNGGVASVDQASKRPIDLITSGPASAVGALRALATSGEQDLLSMEIGGTSCDVMLMEDGRVTNTESQEISGYHVATPAVDIHSVAAGGGTIARVDSAGLLCVGPRGAGARPGPACYGLGGTEPTVTDAQLVLGRLGPGEFGEGAVRLHPELAHAAIERELAKPLGLEVEQAAWGVVQLLEQHLLHAVERISLERGRDPRRFTLVAAGGAGAMHGASVGRLLGCETVCVPRQAGAFCAWGAIHSDVSHDFFSVFFGPMEQETLKAAAERFGQLERQATTWLDAEASSLEDRQITRQLDLRYRAQHWSIPIDTDSTRLDMTELRSAFEQEHQRLFGHTQPDGRVEITGLRVTAVGILPRVPRQEPRKASPEANGSATAAGERLVYLDPATGWTRTPIWHGPDIGVGRQLAGPLIVEEETTTIVVGPHDHLEVGPDGHYRIHLQINQPQINQPQINLDSHRDTRRIGAMNACLTTSDSSLDPVTLALVQNRLDSIARQMGWVMTRTARSPIFSQSHDFSCFLADAAGTLVSQADGIPIHTGGGGFAVRAILQTFGDRIEPGDVFLLNDPYAAGGNHLPDWVIARPVFAANEGREQLFAFTCNRAHQSDIGGGAAGTYNPEATEIFHEGLRLPPLKLIERGELREDLWQLLLLNSRTPEMMDGDLRAMIGSTRIGGERVLALVDELGSESASVYFEGILSWADRHFRSTIAQVPDGLYQTVEAVTNDCFGPVDLAIRVALTIDGDQVRVDFSGTDDQMRGFKNSSLANTYSAVYMALSSFFEPDLPRNEGTFRNTTITAPHGSLVNPKPPAPVTMCTVFLAHEIVHAIWRALGQALPEQSCAGWAKTIHNVTAGQQPDSGETFVMYHWNTMPGGGAVDGRDGFNQIGHLIALGGLTMPNLEVNEQVYPVRFLKHEYRRDAAGPGRYRGGSGIDYEAEILVPARYSFRGEGIGPPTGFGVQGGREGAGGSMTLHVGDDEELVAPPYGSAELGPARIVAHSPGGGGWGDPLERDPEMVLRDVLDEVVSREAAETEYGVVLRANPTSSMPRVDADATRRLRKEGRRRAPPLRRIGVETPPTTEN